MKSWILAASSALFVAGCGGGAATNEAAAGNTAEAPANGAVEANAGAPAAQAAATNVAIGRWTGAADKCDEMADVEFTATAIRIFGGPAGSSMDIPITYRDATATSVTMQTEPGQPTIVATVQDPTHIVLTSPGRPERNCTLARRPA